MEIQNPPSNLGKSLTEQIIEKINKFLICETFAGGLFRDNKEQIMYTNGYKDGYSQARTEMVKVIPEILSFIKRELIEELTYYHNDIAVTEIDWGVDYIRVDDLLEKLK